MDDIVVMEGDELYVIVTGSREWQDEYVICEDLQFIYQTGCLRAVITGGARGADEWADEWVQQHEDVERFVFPADWKAHGRSAGPIRNRAMVNFAKQAKIVHGVRVIVLAYPHTESKGTFDMMRVCRDANLPVFNRAG